MRGCLSLPFRILGFLIFLALCWVAWSYRREIKRTIHRWTAEDSTISATGRPGEGGTASAARRIEDLLQSRADSVVLSPGDVAGLLDSLARVVAPGAIDSLTVTLEREDLGVRARVDTRAVPVSLGAIGSVVRDHEFVEAGGRVIFRQPGRAEWQLDRVRVRGVPLPAELVGRLVRRFAAPETGTVLGFAIPRTVTGLRVAPGGITLYGTGTGR